MFLSCFPHHSSQAFENANCIFKVIEVDTDDKFDQEDGWAPHPNKLHLALVIHPPVWKKWSFEFVGCPKYECYHEVVKTTLATEVRHLVFC